jgi:3-deoxy-D-manno-octulosonic-acid transferase
MGLLFDAVYLLLAAIAAPLWMRKQRAGWRERWGHIEPLPKQKKPRVMLHAVSVGEVGLLRPLVRALEGDFDLVISVTTDTGIERARALYTGRAHIVRYPLDASRAVRRFLDAVNPDLVALVELELWPNFSRACRKRRIPLGIINGRLSDRSHWKYALAWPILGGHFRRLAFCCAQDTVYAKRFRRAGVRKKAITVCGSMKWDASVVADTVPGAEELRKHMGIDPERLLIVAGSTAPDEHKLLHDATPDGVQLLCAPRRPEWFDLAADEMPRCVRWSKTERPILAKDTVRRFLLDTIGVLREAYALADIVVVGRSFGSLYGSDPMEPAALAKPVIIGPNVADFRTIVAAMKERDAIIQTTRADLPAVLKRLCEDEAERRALGKRAQDCVRAHQGATDAHVRAIRKAVGRPAGKQKKPRPQSAKRRAG